MSGLDKVLFNLKFTSKQLKRQAAKAEKDAQAEKAKLKRALTRNPPHPPEVALVHATASVRNETQYKEFIRLAARVDALAGHVQTAISTRTMTQSVAQAAKGIEAALQKMDLGKVGAIMEKFESQSEDLGVVGGYYESVAGGLESQQVGVEGHGEVDALMRRVADEAGVELSQGLQQGNIPSEEPSIKEGKQGQLTSLEEGLENRLRALRN